MSSLTAKTAIFPALPEAPYKKVDCQNYILQVFIYLLQFLNICYLIPIDLFHEYPIHHNFDFADYLKFLLDLNLNLFLTHLPALISCFTDSSIESHFSIRGPPWTNDPPALLQIPPIIEAPIEVDPIIEWGSLP